MKTLRVPMELVGTVPREVRLTRSGVAMVVASAALAFTALGLAIGLTFVYRLGAIESERRVREAVPAAATVSAVNRVRDDDEIRYVVRYDYLVDGRRYAGRIRVRPSEGRRLVVGATLPIEYMSSRPADSWRAGRRPAGMAIWVIPIAVLTALAGAAGLLWPVVGQFHFLAEARPARARVVSLTKGRGKKRDTATITFEFDTLSGATRKSSTAVGKNPPPVGSDVTILYHRERPEWTALYPLQFVRPLRESRHEMTGGAALRHAHK